MAGLRGTLSLTFEEGTWAAWLYDLLEPHVAKLVVLQSAQERAPQTGQQKRQDRCSSTRRSVVVATNWKQGVKAVHAQGGCSDATLTGNYPVVLTGASAPGHSTKGMNNVPAAAVGVVAFDGAGSFSDTYTIVFNGHAATASDTGNYNVNSDCTGMLSECSTNPL